jgi:hypothetical protein
MNTTTSVSYVSEVTVDFDTEDRALVPEIGAVIEISVLGKTSAFRVQEVHITARITWDNEREVDVLWYAGTARCARA